MKILTQEIPKRSPCCAHCKIPLLRGVEVISVLLEEAPFRADYCSKCAIEAPKDTPRWRSQVPERIKSRYSDLKREERALAILKDLLIEPADKWGEIFILAQFLDRKKILLLRQDLVSMQGIPLSIYEVAETEEILKIPRLDPKTLPLAQIQASLASYLSGCLEIPIG